MGLQVGELFATLGVKTAPFDAAMAKLPAMFAPLKVGAVGAGIAVAGALGTAAFKIGESFDAAYDKIRLDTGATGQAFEDLKDTFKDVASQTGASFDDIAAAVAGLSTRTGATGKRLSNLSLQMLRMAKIGKQDVGETVRLATRFFGDWSIATEKQAEALDMVYRSSQMTGISMNELMSIAVQFGAPLRMLGIGFEGTLAMLGKWEKEGVNTTTVLTGMKFALKTFARAGEEPVAALAKYTKQIKEAKTTTEAASIAAKVFGLRAGSDMAAAIREGRFEWEDLKAAIVNGSDTLKKAAKDTNSWEQAWARMKNSLMVAFEPVATKVFTGMSKAAIRLADWVDANKESLATGFAYIGKGISTAFKGVAGIIRGIIDAFHKMYDAGDRVGDWLARMGFLGKNPAADQIAALPIVLPKDVHNLQEANTAILTMQGSLKTLKDILASEWGSLVPDRMVNATKRNINLAIEAIKGMMPALALGKDAKKAGQDAMDAWVDGMIAGTRSARGSVKRSAAALGKDGRGGVEAGLGDGKPVGNRFGSQVSGGLSDTSGNARSAGKKVGAAAHSGAASGIGSGLDIGLTFGLSVAAGLSSNSVLSALATAGAAIAAAAEAAVRKNLKNGPPSRVGIDIGRVFGRSIAAGLTGAGDAVDRAGSQIAGRMARASAATGPQGAGSGLTFVNQGTIVGIDDLADFIGAGLANAQMAAGIAAARF